jgi:hypothetical protein
MMVYLGASLPLRLIPWDSAKPAFHVTDMLPEFRNAVAPQLGTPHVYYAGSYEQCGCGFQVGQYPDPENPRPSQERDSLRAFRDYLQAELSSVPEIRVFACWADDEGEPPQHRRSLTPDDLVRDDFYFLEGELSVVRTGGRRG